MLNCVLLFFRVVWLPGLREARLGRRVSECVVASGVWGFGVGAKICVGLMVRRAAGRVEGVSFKTSRLAVRRCF